MDIGLHMQHDALFSPCLISVAERAQRIRAIKPEGEIPLRLRLLQAVAADRFPPAVVAAALDYGRLWIEAVTAHANELDALHRALCPDCPWDGGTIFPSPRMDG